MVILARPHPDGIDFPNGKSDICGLCMKVTLKTILPLSGQGLHPSKKIISSRKLLPLL